MGSSPARAAARPWPPPPPPPALARPCPLARCARHPRRPARTRLWCALRWAAAASAAALQGSAGCARLFFGRSGHALTSRSCQAGTAARPARLRCPARRLPRSPPLSLSLRLLLLLCRRGWALTPASPPAQSAAAPHAPPLQHCRCLRRRRPTSQSAARAPPTEAALREAPGAASPTSRRAGNDRPTALRPSARGREASSQARHCSSPGHRVRSQSSGHQRQQASRRRRP